MVSRFFAISLMLATVYSNAFGSCLEYGILGVNAKKGGDKSLDSTAKIAAGGTLVGTYAISSIAGATALLATGGIVGVATIGVTSYLIKRSKNTNTDLLDLANQILNKEISLESLEESNSLVSHAHIKLSRHLKRFIEIKNELNENLGTELSNLDLADLIIYLDNNSHVKNSEKIHPTREKTLAVMNPFCSFSKTKLVLKGFKLEYKLVRRTFKHKAMVELLTAAYNEKSLSVNDSVITK